MKILEAVPAARMTRRWIWIGTEMSLENPALPGVQVKVFKPSRMRRRDTSRYNPKDCVRAGKR
jgi:hypothetical protein